jgi:dihydropyrimidinase
MKGVRLQTTLIRGGTVVDAGRREKADVLVRGETVDRVAADLAAADRVIDATGCYVLPGVVDVHTHPVYVDDLESLPVTAAHGGVTTVIHYAYAKPGTGLVEAIRRFREEAERVSILDFALHGGLFDPKRQSGEIPAAMAEGVTSFKMFMTYAKLGWMTDDYQLMRTLDLLGRVGGMGMVHAENGLATDYLEDACNAAGVDPVVAFVRTRPAGLEAEAVGRAIAMAEVAGCPLYIPHVSAERALDVIAAARRAGRRVYAETCPQYLTLTNQDLLEKKALLKIGPPLRDETDRDALWRGLADGVLDTVASDHAAKDKRVDDDFFAAPYGSPQVETMLQLVHDGVARGRLTLERLVRVLCENPARIFGLYPKKGTLRPGSDADIVIFDPSARACIEHRTQHSRASYTAYEGRSVAGVPVLTMQRGEILVARGERVASAGRARFLTTAAGRADLRDLA